MLVGDFDGHNVLWGCNDNDPRGELIEDFITKNDICLMNDKSNTYLDSGKGTFSSLDLSLCHPSLYLDFDWSVCEDQRGSDHFPILIESVQTHDEAHNPKWKLNKADWDLFHTLCNESLTDTFLSDSSDPITDFTSSLINISEKCIPKTSTNPKKSNPWYNDDCKEAIKQRKDTLSKFCKFPTHENLNIYRNSRAKARRTIKSAKRKSWRTYVSNLNYKTPTKKFGTWLGKYPVNLNLLLITILITISTMRTKLLFFFFFFFFFFFCSGVSRLFGAQGSPSSGSLLSL